MWYNLVYQQKFSMLQISNLSVQHAETKKQILHDISVTFETGKTYLLQGPNGSGKSTLVNTIMGNPEYTISQGSISLLRSKTQSPNDPNPKDFEHSDLGHLKITKFSPTDRSRLGLFLANQYPIEIPGVSLLQYLRLLYQTHHPEDKMPVFAFKKFVKEKAQLIGYPEKLLDRHLNEGFSGGEKKKTEILQMLLVEPKIIMLDELDSGLDKKSTTQILQFIASYKKEHRDLTLIIISHYDSLLQYITPDKIIEFEEGKIITS